MTTENRTEVQPGIRQKAKRERTEKQQFEQAVNRVYDVFCDYFHLLNRWAEEHAPRSPTEDLHKRLDTGISKWGNKSPLLCYS